MLFLYDKNDIALKGEGRGSLQDFLTEPQVTWNGSGFFELEFTYLIQGDLANHIVRDAYIKTTTKPDDDTYLSFAVYEVEPDYIENTIYVKAELTLLHELRDRVVPSNAYTGTAGAMMRNLKANLDRALDFEIVDNTTRQSYVEFEDTNAYEIIFGDSGIVEATGVEIDINDRGFILRDVMGTVHQDELRESDYVSQLTINENHNDIVTRIIPTTVLMVDTAVRDGDRYTRETVETRVYGTPIVSSVVDDKDYRVRTQFVEYRNEQIEGEVKTYTYQREGETETLEMNYYLYEDVSQLNQDALGFFGVNSGIDEPNIELTIETLGLNPVENNYLQSLSKYDIVTVYLEDVHDSYKLYEVQVNETVYEPLVNQITKLGFTTESITLREATRNVNEGRVSSQRLQAELERQRQKDLEKRLRNYIYDARGRRMEFGSVLPDPDEYSNGDIYYLETADGSDIYELVDGAWEFKIGDKTGQIVEDAIREIQEQTDEIAEELETNIGRTDTLFEEWEDMKENFNYDELENSFINIVGNDGKWVYSNNRLYVEGEQTSDVSSNEVILTLEEGEKVLTHNGEGFSVGNDYTFSYANPTFVERPKSLVTVNFDPVPLHEVFVSLSPDHPQYPIGYKRTTGNNNQFPNTYHDKYTIGTSSEWYQFAYEFVEVDKPQTVTLPLIYKEGTLTITHNDADLFIDGESIQSKGSVTFNVDFLDNTRPPKKKGTVTFGTAPEPSIPNPSPTESKFQSARVVNLSDYGGNGNGTADNFNALQSVIDLSVNEPIVLEVEAGDYFVQGGTNQRLEPFPYQSKGLRIEGKGNVNFLHKNNRNNQKHEYYFMQMIMLPDSLGFEVENIHLNGIRNGQEELFYTISENNPISNIPMAKGISVHGAHHVIFNNVKFSNMYGGYAINASEYRDLNITNIEIDKVGGHDTTESFGMAIYISGHTEDAVINIDNVHAKGMVGREPDYMSWIGITFENGTIQSQDESLWLVDINTEVNITNSSFLDYHATFHVESWAGNMYFNTDNIISRSSTYQVVAGVLGEYWEVSNNVNMEIKPFGHIWRIIKGIYHTDKENEDNFSGLTRMFMHNSEITYVPETGFSHITGMASYGNSTVAHFENVQLNNVPDYLVQNGSAYFTDSVINLMQGNNKTAQQLQQSWMNDPRQEVVFTNTTVNPYGQHKQVIKDVTPEKATPTGYIPPPFTEPLAPPI